MENQGRNFLIVGNWKMNMTAKEGKEFVKGLIHSAEKIKNVEIVVCPSFPSLFPLFEEIEGTKIGLGAQNIYFEDKGAYTGEVSPHQIKPFCRYVILGHSERRNIFGETDEMVNKKVLSALKHSLVPIICVGEKIEEREAERTIEIIEKQVKAALIGVERRHLPRIVFAYEPIWAIGTGLVPESQDAASVILYIRRILSELYDQSYAYKTKILYGGSVNSRNADNFLKEPGIDGLLIGGASLNLAEFAGIIREAEKIEKIANR